VKIEVVAPQRQQAEVAEHGGHDTSPHEGHPERDVVIDREDADRVRTDGHEGPWRG
jgi:hypothetical protein